MNPYSEVTISVICDNRTANPLLQEEWGLSLFIEHSSKKILFDAGGDLDTFVGNMDKLRIRPEELTHVIISHKHGDHIAGTEYVLEKLHKNAKVFLPEFFPISSFNKKYEFSAVSSPTHEVEKDVHILGLRCGSSLHEQTLLLSTRAGLVAITGCAHPGIVEILGEIKSHFPATPISCVMGGFHLYETAATRIAEIVQAFQDYDIQRVAPCHCSGDLAIGRFREAYGKNFIPVGVGAVLTL